MLRSLLGQLRHLEIPVIVVDDSAGTGGRTLNAETVRAMQAGSESRISRIDQAELHRVIGHRLAASFVRPLGGPEWSVASPRNAGTLVANEFFGRDLVALLYLDDDIVLESPDRGLQLLLARSSQDQAIAGAPILGMPDTCTLERNWDIAPPARHPLSGGCALVPIAAARSRPYAEIYNEDWLLFLSVRARFRSILVPQVAVRQRWSYRAPTAETVRREMRGHIEYASRCSAPSDRDPDSWIMENPGAWTATKNRWLGEVMAEMTKRTSVTRMRTLEREIQEAMKWTPPTDMWRAGEERKAAWRQVFARRE